MTNYVILLPPSEGKRKGYTKETEYKEIVKSGDKNFFAALDINRNFIHGKLLEAFQVLEESHLEKLFGVKDKNLKEAIEASEKLLENFVMEAIYRYDGVMFKSIDYENMEDYMKYNFNHSVLFISGMFGLLTPMDLIPDYKLKIGSKILDVDLTSYWKMNLKDHFKNSFKDKIVIDILPEAHRKVVDFESSKEFFSIIFMDDKNGKLKQAGHNSKILKGEIVRYICEEEKITRKYLEEFEHSDGYKFDKDLSDENKIVFLKKF